MECKFLSFFETFQISGQELIDTLWNVNTHHTTLTVPSRIELIDTLWNVNFNKSIILSDGFMN